MGRRQMAEQRRVQLIDTALALFAEKGYEHATMKDLAQRAGVAQGLVYHYFRGKDDLLAAVIARHNPLDRLREALRDVAHVPASEQLPRLLRLAYEVAMEKRDLLRIVLREVLVNPDVVAPAVALRERGLGLLAEYLSARVAAGELRPHDTAVSARMVASGVVFLVLTGAAPEPFIAEWVALLLRGIAAT